MQCSKIKGKKRDRIVEPIPRQLHFFCIPLICTKVKLSSKISLVEAEVSDPATYSFLYKVLMDGWKDECMGGRTNGLMEGQMYGWMDGRMNGWMDECMDGRTNVWVEGRM